MSVEKVMANSGKWYSVYYDDAGFYKVEVHISAVGQKKSKRVIWRRGQERISVTADCAKRAALAVAEIQLRNFANRPLK